MKKLIASLFAILYILCLIVPCCAAASQTPDAKSAILIDVASGRVLYSKNEKEKLPMASTTKIMTAITAIENGRLDDVVTASLRAQNTGGSSIYLQAGEKLSLEDLLYGLMLQSGNDAAVAIAEHIGGSIEGFSGMMNEKAAEIGVFNSSFANPHGLDNPGHYTTAEDLGKVASYALRNQTFSAIVSTKQKKIPWWGRSYNRILNNKNKLLWNLEGGDGVKTGYTSNAGRCLVSSATRDGWQLAGAVLNCGPMWEESINMLEYGFSFYKPVTFYEQGQFVKTVAVANGKKDRVRLVTDRLVRIPLTAEEEEKVTVVEEWEDIIRAPVEEGQAAGSVKIELEGKVLFRANLICQESIKEKSLKKSFFDILSNAI